MAKEDVTEAELIALSRASTEAITMTVKFMNDDSISPLEASLACMLYLSSVKNTDEPGFNHASDIFSRGMEGFPG